MSVIIILKSNDGTEIKNNNNFGNITFFLFFLETVIPVPKNSEGLKNRINHYHKR